MEVYLALLGASVDNDYLYRTEALGLGPIYK